MGARVWSLDMTGSGRWRHVPTITGRIDWRADSRMSSGPAWRTCPAYFWEPPRERAGRRSRLLLTAPTAVGTDGSPEHVLDHYREAFGVVIGTGWPRSAGQDPYRKGDERPIEFRAFRLKAPDQWWTQHAEERLHQWNEERGVTRSEVEHVVMTPDQVVPGHGEAQVAQSRRGPGLLRVPYVEEDDERILLTLYWTSKTDKYWDTD